MPSPVPPNVMSRPVTVPQKDARGGHRREDYLLCTG